MTKKCSRCKEEKSIDCFSRELGRKDGLSYYCKECWSKASKGISVKNTMRNSQLRHLEKNKNKKKARSVVNNLLKRGKLEKTPCFLCGITQKLEAHHLSYNYPDKIIWLCLRHHSEIHHD